MAPSSSICSQKQVMPTLFGEDRQMPRKAAFADVVQRVRFVLPVLCAFSIDRHERRTDQAGALKEPLGVE
jgi:hypothetical protein